MDTNHSVAIVTRILLLLVLVAGSVPVAMAQKTPAAKSGSAISHSRAATKAPAAAARTGSKAERPAESKNRADDDDEEEDDDDGDDDADLDSPPVAPKAGTAEWFVRETARLRLERAPQNADEAAVDKEHRQRQQKIIEYSQKAIGLVHKDPAKDRVFQVAARHMLEARLQLAMTGDEDQIAALYEEARALYRRDTKSAAAAEGAHALVNLAYHFATSHPQDSAHWQKEFAKQAIHFLKTFPADRARSVPLAYTAGCLCEQKGHASDAVACFDLLVQVAPETQHAQEAAAIARRLRLPGNPPQLAGQTLGDDPFALDDFLGKPVLVVFWSSESEGFAKQLPLILPVIRKAARAGLQVVGVSLDTEREAAIDFASRQKLDWTHLFSAAPQEQGWNNPVARYYGVFEVPAYWLIDASGNVTSTTSGPKTLGRDLARLLEDSGVAQGAAAEAEVVPAAGSKAGGADAGKSKPPKAVPGARPAEGSGKGGVKGSAGR